MRVDVGCSGEIAVPQPFLYLLHGYATRQQQAGAAMPKIVKADSAKVIVPQQAGKTVRDIAGLDEITHFVYKDIPGVIHVVRLPTHFAVACFAILAFQQPIAKFTHQRQCAHAGFGFRSVGGDQHLLSIQMAGGHRVANRERVAGKINRIPL